MIGFLTRLLDRREPALSEATPRDAAAIATLHGKSFHRGWSHGEIESLILARNVIAHRALVRGVRPGRVLAQMMGREAGPTRGRDGNMHFGDRELGCVGMVSMLPDMALVACGLALSFQMGREPRVAMTWFGEGSTANGVWHEAMNVAGVRQLPVVFVLENNQFAYSTPNDHEFAVDPVARAEGYGFP